MSRDLKTIRKALDRKKELNVEIDKLSKSLFKLETSIDKLSTQVKKEENDVIELENDSIVNKFYQLTNTYNEKYQKEIYEYEKVYEKYNFLISQSETLRKQIINFTDKYESIRYTENDYLVLRTSKADKLAKIYGNQSKITKLVNKYNYVTNQISGIDRAYNEGKELFGKVQKIHTYLNLYYNSITKYDEYDYIIKYKRNNFDNEHNLKSECEELKILISDYEKSFTDVNLKRKQETVLKDFCFKSKSQLDNIIATESEYDKKYYSLYFVKNFPFQNLYELKKTLYEMKVVLSKQKTTTEQKIYEFIIEKEQS